MCVGGRLKDDSNFKKGEFTVFKLIAKLSSELRSDLISWCETNVNNKTLCLPVPLLAFVKVCVVLNIFCVSACMQDVCPCV